MVALEASLAARFCITRMYVKNRGAVEPSIVETSCKFSVRGDRSYRHTRTVEIAPSRRKIGTCHASYRWMPVCLDPPYVAL
jgi:hypothetical protein